MPFVASDVSYVSDGNGNTTAVLVPIHVWRAMKQDSISEKKQPLTNELNEIER